MTGTDGRAMEQHQSNLMSPTSHNCHVLRPAFTPERANAFEVASEVQETEQVSNAAITSVWYPSPVPGVTTPVRL